MTIHPLGAFAQPPDQPRPKDVGEAAKQFEALLLNQMLRTAHDSEEHEDSTSETMWDVASQQFSKVIAENGGMGIARMIVQGLTKQP
jgi:Rod binding domain-containing protein